MITCEVQSNGSYKITKTKAKIHHDEILYLCRWCGESLNSNESRKKGIHSKCERWEQGSQDDRVSVMGLRNLVKDSMHGKHGEDFYKAFDREFGLKPI